MQQDIQKIIEAAKREDPGAEYALGFCYHSGRNEVEQDYGQALSWYRKAAEHGHIKAAFYLGTLYQDGKGTEQNYSEAAKWYKKASDGGNDRAQLALGLLYSGGLGVKRDYSASFVLFNKAAEQGNVKAMLCLGMQYANGKGTEKNYSEAMKYFKEADSKGEIKASYYIGLMYRDGLGVAQDYQEASEWFRKAAENGDVKARKILQELTNIPAHQSQGLNVINSAENPGKNNSSNKVKWLACTVGFILLLVITAGGIYYLAENYLYGVPAEFRAMSQYELDKALVKAVIENSNPSLVKTLIKAGANVDARCPEGGDTADFYVGLGSLQASTLPTPLMLAVSSSDNRSHDDLNIAKILIKAGANVNDRNKNNFTPLMYAVSNHNPNPEVIDLLIDAGAEVNYKRKSIYKRKEIEMENALNIAVLMYTSRPNKNGLEIIKKLIKAGIDVNNNVILEGTPLGHILDHAEDHLDLHIQVIETLINAGADVNKKSNFLFHNPSPLMIELSKSEPSPRIVKTLVNAGANVNERIHPVHKLEAQVWDEKIPKFRGLLEGVSPLMVAVAHKPDMEIINTLIKAGADVNARENTYNITVLMIAATYSDSSSIIETLIKAGADVNTVSYGGKTALDFANYKNNYSAASTLRRYGAK